MILNVTGKLAIDMRAREWCRLPYPNHPRGCPNYDTGRLSCPPDAPLVMDKFDLSKPHWFVVVEFNMKAHVEKLRAAHPDWTDRQLRCCLYWQGGVRKLLRQLSEDFVSRNPGTEYTTCPEAMGVHVLKTLREFGVPVRKKITDTVYKVSLAGYQTGNTNQKSSE